MKLADLPSLAFGAFLAFCAMYVTLVSAAAFGFSETWSAIFAVLMFAGAVLFLDRSVEK